MIKKCIKQNKEIKITRRLIKKIEILNNLLTINIETLSDIINISVEEIRNIWPVLSNELILDEWKLK